MDVIIAVSTTFHYLYMSSQSTLLDDTLVPRAYLTFNKHDDDEVPSTDGGDNLADLAGDITHDDIKNIQRIGSGGFGTVFILEHRTLGKLALKRLDERGDRENERRRARREGRLWRGLKHPHVLDFMGVLESETFFCFVCPFQQNGSLDRFLKENPAIDRIQMIVECADALAYLHREGIIHGDIRAANVLVSDDVHALLCDFGLSRPSDNATSTAVHGAGSARWMSPELLRGEGKTFASDVWAVGMMAYEILSGRVPFDELCDLPSVIRAVVTLKQLPPKEPTKGSDGASYKYIWAIATECWNANPTKRPSMDTVFVKLSSGTTCASLTGSTAGQVVLKQSPPSTIRNNISDKTLSAITLRSVLRQFQPRQSVHILRGHSGLVWSAVFSPDSRTLASASWDGTIRLWDVAQAIPLGEPLKGHAGRVYSAAFSPDGTTLISGSDDCTLRLWDVSTGRAIGKLLTGHTNWVWSVAVSPDGRTIASSSSDKTIRIWDMMFRNCIAVLEGHTELVRSIAFSPDGKTLVSGSWDDTVRRWDMTTCKQIGDPTSGHNGTVQSVAFSPDGSTIASGSDATTICLWDARSGGRKGSPLDRHTSTVFSVAFHPNSRLLASGSGDNTIRIWDLTTAPPTTKLELKNHTQLVCSVTFSLNGKWLVSGSADKTIQLWDLELLLSIV